jgi:beta-glucosidase
LYTFLTKTRPVAGPLGRSPLGGRNWEGFAADPYLTGVAMDLTIRGVQSQGVQASAKHYIGNEQETQRSSTEINGTTIEALSSNIDDRKLHEV